MVTIDDLASSISTVLSANSTFASAVPGLACFLRSFDTPTSYPYAVFDIEKGSETEYTSDGTYLQTWNVELAAFTRQGTDTNPNAIQIAMHAALNSVPGQPSPLTLRSGTVLHCLPSGVEGKFDEKLWQGRDVFVASGGWEILLEGSVGL